MRQIWFTNHWPQSDISSPNGFTREINDHRISKFFSAKGDGMLPGDIVWDFIKKRLEENLNMMRVMLLTNVQTVFNVKIVNILSIQVTAC